MNLPNKLTLTRLLFTLAAVVMYCIFGKVAWNMFLILGLFVVGSFTDFLDGVIARKYNLVTGFGKLMDPLADKMLVISCMFILIDVGTIPYWWIVLIIIAREFLVLGIRLAALEGGHEVIAAKLMGKLKTMTQMVSMSILFFTTAIRILVDNQFLQILEFSALILFYVSVVLCIISGIQYTIQNRKYFKMK